MEMVHLERLQMSIGQALHHRRATLNQSIRDHCPQHTAALRCILADFDPSRKQRRSSEFFLGKWIL